MAQVVEGALLGGTILPEKDFKSVLLELLENNEYEKQIVLLLKRAYKDVKANNITALYNEIETLQTKLFQNPTTSLMVITNLKGPAGDYQWYWNHSEKKTLAEKNGGLRFSELKRAIAEKQAIEMLSAHLEELIKYVESKKLTNEDYDRLFKSDYYNFGEYSKKKDMGERADDKTRKGKTLAYVFYGTKELPHERGQITDAFLNHVGNMHKTLLGDFIIKAPTESFKPVQVEEGLNFYQLLIDSSNNAAWQTGGDLILLSGNQIIANIQLKTIMENRRSYVGSISSDDISKKIKQLIGYTESRYSIYNKKVFVDLCYKLFKTSGIVHSVEEKIQQIPLEYAKNNLKNINYRGIKITFS